MSDTTAAKKVKTGAKKGRAKMPTTHHPKYIQMVVAAIQHYKERKGSSKHKIFQYIMKNYDVGHDEKLVNMFVKLALRVGVKSGTLVQVKGVGASGSFRIGAVKAPPKKKAAAKKPKESKVKKSPKKKAATAKPAKKATTPKAKKPKKTTVKKAKPAAASKPKKSKASPARKPAKKAAPTKKAAKPAAKKAVSKKK